MKKAGESTAESVEIQCANPACGYRCLVARSLAKKQKICPDCAQPFGKMKGFVKAGDLLPGFEQLVPVLQEVKQMHALTVQGVHHFNSYKQLNALSSIGDDASPDMGFMNRLLTLCSLPRTDPGSRPQYKRQNGPYKLVMIAGGDNKLPFGNLPRLLLAWVCTEAVRTGERRLNLGSSLASFMHQLGIMSDSGGSRGDRTRLKAQIDRLFNCHIDLIYEDRGVKISTGGRVARTTALWWDYHHPNQQSLWKSWLELGEELFNEIIEHPIPIDMRILKAMRRSSLGLDVYMWISYKSYLLYSQKKKPERLPWELLYIQFGAEPSLVNDKDSVQNFRKDMIRELRKLKLCWPALDFATPQGCLELRPCPPSISPKALTGL